MGTFTAIHAYNDVKLSETIDQQEWNMKVPGPHVGYVKVMQLCWAGNQMQTSHSISLNHTHACLATASDTHQDPVPPQPP